MSTITVEIWNADGTKQVVNNLHFGNLPKVGDRINYWEDIVGKEPITRRFIVENVFHEIRVIRYSDYQNSQLYFARIHCREYIGEDWTNAD